MTNDLGVACKVFVRRSQSGNAVGMWIKLSMKKEVVQSGVHGYLGEGANEWEAALSSLVADPRLRNHMGVSGTKRIEDWYPLQAQAPRIIEVLRNAAERSAP